MYNRLDYSYTLPEDLIAEEAIHPHHDARLMVINREDGSVVDDSTFWNLDSYLGNDRVIFFNNSRVLRARIALENIIYSTALGEEKTLMEGEIFYLNSREDATFEALVRPGNKFKVGNIFTVGEFRIEVISMTDTGRVLKIQGSEHTIQELLSTHGALPLPPYIEYKKEKEKDYQTSFAEKDGSVAAPTASLHFTQALVRKIENEKRYITLHVGLGTFKGIDTADIREYAIHHELVEVPLSVFGEIASIKTSGKKIVAVGTTACRTLESLPSAWKKLSPEERDAFDENICKYWDTLTSSVSENTWIHSIKIDSHGQSLNFETSIYITPGYRFLIIDDLITNFHLPESSLLVLVSAFMGYEATMEAYRQAIEKKYRFYSFGDGMYIRGK